MHISCLFEIFSRFLYAVLAFIVLLVYSIQLKITEVAIFAIVYPIQMFLTLNLLALMPKLTSFFHCTTEHIDFANDQWTECN
jgi:hypothetical protein